MFDYYVLSLILSGIALLVSAFVAVGFFRAARESGKEPARWALIGWGTFVAVGIVAGKVLYLAAWLWERGVRPQSGVALGDIFHTSWFLEAVPLVLSTDSARLLSLLCALKLAMIAAGLLAAEITARAAGLKKPAGFDQQAKTVSFLGAAAALVLIAWATVPATLADDAGEVFGQLLFPDLKREDITGIEIAKFNEKKASEQELDLKKLTPREVAAALRQKLPKTAGDDQPRWFIATHDYYPAEAKGLTEQEKKELTQKEERDSDAKKEGSAAETERRLREEAERRAIELRRKSQLAQAIGGLMGLKIEDVAGSSPGDHAGYGVVDPKNRKEGSQGCGTRVVLKGGNGQTLMALIIGKSVPNRPDMRFVRRVDDDTVFVARVDPRNLPVRFSAWIEADLLKLNVLHARGLDLLDFDFTGDEPDLTRHLSLASDDGSAWRLVVDAEVQGGKMAKRTIPAGKEIDSMKVGDLVGDLRSIEIIDVRRKPPLLSQVLRGDTKGVPQQAFQSLAESLADHGFYLQKNLYPRDGEIHCQMDDGVRYVLKFGSVAPTTELAAKEVDELLEKQVAGADAAAEEKADKDKNAKAGKTRYLFVMVDLNDPVAEEFAKKEVAKGKPAKTKDDKPAEKDAEGKDKPAEKDAEGKDKPAEETKKDKETSDQETAADAEAVKEILDRNRARADELNARFAEWYYVISDDTYQKLHVPFDKLLRDKPSEKPPAGGPGDGHGMDDGHDHGAEERAAEPLQEFHELKREGLGAQEP